MSGAVPAEAVEAAAHAAWVRYGVRSEPGYVRTLLEAAAPHLMADARGKIFAHLELYGGDYDLRYSASTGKLADDLLGELTP